MEQQHPDQNYQPKDQLEKSQPQDRNVDNLLEDHRDNTVNQIEPQKEANKYQQNDQFLPFQQRWKLRDYLMLGEKMSSEKITDKNIGDQMKMHAEQPYPHNQSQQIVVSIWGKTHKNKKPAHYKKKKKEVEESQSQKNSEVIVKSRGRARNSKLTAEGRGLVNKDKRRGRTKKPIGEKNEGKTNYYRQKRECIPLNIEIPAISKPETRLQKGRNKASVQKFNGWRGVLGDCDFDSNEPEIGEESDAYRRQSSVFHNLLELAMEGGNDLVERVGQLAPLHY